MNRGLAWVSAASSAVGVLDIVAIIIILRYLSPEEYGIAVLAFAYYPVLDVLGDMGLSAAVVQRDDHSIEKLSTVFWMNLMVTCAIALALLAVSPLIGMLQGHAVVGSMLGAYAIKVLLGNVYAIPNSLMRKELRFRELSTIRVWANVGEFAAKVGFAVAGFGVWCFVAGRLAHVVITAAGSQYFNRWWPRLHFRPSEVRGYMSFGLKTWSSEVLYQFYTNIDITVVNSFFGAAATGLYRLAYELVLQPVRMISNIVREIAFPAFARLRHRRDRLVEQFLAFTRMNLVVVLPVLAFFLLDVDDLILLGWGPEWVPAATAARLLCAVGVLRALSFVVPPLLDGIGRPNLTLTYTLVAALVLPACYVAFAWLLGPELGYLSVAVSWAVGYPVAFAVLALLAFRELELSPRRYLQRTTGIVGCVVVAMSLSRLAELGAPPIPAIRLAITAGVILVVFCTLLAYTQGISPRSIVRSLRTGSAAASSSPAPIAESLPPVVATVDEPRRASLSD